MKLKCVLLAASFSLVFLASVGSAQVTDVVQRWVSVSRVLAGHVDVGLVGTPASDVTVEVRSSDGRKVLASTKTDGNHFEQPKAGGLVHLHLSAPGMNPYELRVRIKKSGDPELRIHMNIAT